MTHIWSLQTIYLMPKLYLFFSKFTIKKTIWVCNIFHSSFNIIIHSPNIFMLWGFRNSLYQAIVFIFNIQLDICIRWLVVPYNCLGIIYLRLLLWFIFEKGFLDYYGIVYFFLHFFYRDVGFSILPLFLETFS